MSAIFEMHPMQQTVFAVCEDGDITIAQGGLGIIKVPVEYVDLFIKRLLAAKGSSTATHPGIEEGIIIDA